MRLKLIIQPFVLLLMIGNVLLAARFGGRIISIITNKANSPSALRNGAEPRIFHEVDSGESQFFVAYHYCANAYSKKGEYDKSIQDLKKQLR